LKLNVSADEVSKISSNIHSNIGKLLLMVVHELTATYLELIDVKIRCKKIPFTIFLEM
jgi:hypothetical protein